MLMDPLIPVTRIQITLPMFIMRMPDLQLGITLKAPTITRFAKFVIRIEASLSIMVEAPVMIARRVINILQVLTGLGVRVGPSPIGFVGV